MGDRLFTCEEVYQLNNADGGLKPGTISFKTVSMESSKSVCVRDVQADGQTSLVIVDLDSRSCTRQNIKDADAAAMNPVTRVLALRAGQSVQIFDLDMKTRTKTCTMSEPIVYWRWISPSMLAFVTGTAVYHWSMDGSSGDPVRIFDRVEEMDANVQILNYQVDAQQKWLMLVGVARAADGSLAGKAQLYSAEKSASRVLDGHAGSFCMMTVPGATRDCNVMVLSWNSAAQGGKLMVMELPTGSKQELNLGREVSNLTFSGPQDFPVIASISHKYKLIFIVTSRGSAFLVDPCTSQVIYQEQVTNNVVFCATPSKNGGITFVSNNGSVMNLGINESIIARFIAQRMNNPEMALRVASAANLGGVDDLFRVQLDNLLRMGNVDAAVKIVADSPGTTLRNPQTLNQFQQLGVVNGAPAVSTYFKAMLAVGPLNEVEAVELAKVVLQKGGTAYIKQLMDEDKIACSEELGDLLNSTDSEMALRVYHKANAHHKVVNVLLTRNESQKAVQYCQRVDYKPDWRLVLQNFIRINPQDAVQLALMLHRDMGDKPMLEPNDVVEMFLPGQHIKQVTLFLVEILQGSDTKENGPLQTRLLEINLKHSPPHIAEKILAQNICSHYDALLIAQLCERAGLYQRALENYNLVQVQSDYEQNMLPNMKRCLQHASNMVPEWLCEFFGKVSKTDSLEMLVELMGNAKANFKVIVQIATQYNDVLGSETLIDLFLKYKSYEVLYYYLGAIINYSRDPEVHFRYIESAVEVGQWNEVERLTRESPCYDGERAKNYLKEKRLQNLWPLINVCDTHDYIQELVKYLFDTNNTTYIEQFVQKRSPQKTPEVVGALFDCDAGESLIKSLLNSVGSMCPVGPLVEEAERRGRLKILLPWLEGRRNERNTEPDLHNALAKIYIDTNNNIQEFLEKNEYYDSIVVGKYCENRDPMLAYLSYRRGQCHTDLIRVTTNNGMWKQLARYLVKQQNFELWGSVLKENESVRENRKSFVDAVVQVALPESTVAEEVSTTVKAFMDAEMQAELATLLDKIVVHGSFRSNRYLQNLLLLTSIRARSEKVMEYVNTLDDYDANDIATIALGADMPEVAFTVYDKASLHKEAVKVLLDDVKNVPRARTYANKIDTAPVWSVFGRSLLAQDEVNEGIEALIKAKDPDAVAEVCAAAERTNNFGDLIKYLSMARVESKNRDPKIDTYLVLTYAKTSRLQELEEFLRNTHTVQIGSVADQCFNDGLYDSAKVLYQAASNYPRLASTYVCLKNLPAAMEAAQKAQSMRTWKEVNRACLAEKDYKLAQMSAINIVIHADELSEFCRYYESLGIVEELISTLRASLGHEAAHMGLFTELTVLYAKYKPEKLLEHVKLYSKRINTHRAINACEQFHHWTVLRVLHIANEDWLSAAQCIMEHGADVWDHEVFKDVLTRLSGSDIVYQAVGYYCQFHPDLLHDLLMTLVKNIDPDRIISEVKKHCPVALVKNYLEAQSKPSRKVNDTLNNLYFEEEDFAALSASVEASTNFDSAELATKLEESPLLDFRKVSLMLHRKTKRYYHAVEVAKKNKLYSEAISSASDSADRDVIEGLLRWFVDEGLTECFGAMLYTCYDYIAPDVVMELAWRKGMTDMAMPFYIQSMRDMHDKVSNLESSMQEAKETAKEVTGGMNGNVAGQPPLMIQGNAGYPGYPPQQQGYYQ